jgi:hypothetical protein
MAASAPAAIIHEYNAATDAGGNTTWTDEVGTTNLTFNVSASAGSATGSNLFTAAYEFGGSLTGADAGTAWAPLGAASATSYELWIRPDAFLTDGDGAAGNPTDDGTSKRQILFEFGGTAKGFSISMDNDGTLLGLVKQGANADAPSIIASSADISSLGTDEFIQIIAVYSEPGGNSTLQLYVNGVASGSAASAGMNLAYDGANEGGLANVFGMATNNRNVGAGQEDTSDLQFETEDFTNFLGEIALVRIYDTALSAGEVQDAFNVIVIPAPAALPAGLILIAVIVAMSIRRRRA